MIKPVILAGGSGTRLWPLSRSSKPKQFLNLKEGNETLLQATMNRLEGLNIESSVTICNEEHRFFVAEQLREIDKLGSIILEPIGRNTAPAIAIAALSSNQDEDPLLLVLSSDHAIDDNDKFLATVKKALPLAESGKLVTFGIKAREPNTGYGYIKRGIKTGEGYIVDKFEEKPSKDLAEKYVNSGNYFWNSGMFLFKSSTYLSELKKFRPDIYRACVSAHKSIEADLDFLRIDKENFLKCPSESIDYAVMQETSDAVMVIMDVGWSDIGSWSSLLGISKKDNDGNSTQGDVLLKNTKNTYVKSDEKLVAAIGLEDLVIVSTKDALMVSDINSTADIQAVVENLKEQGREEWNLNREVDRPWGKFDSLDKGSKYQVKRITVNPGAKLSLQMHNHRSEHWIVVSGTAKVTNGKNIITLNENDSTYIPLGEIHTVENPSEVPLEIIEIQVGLYLGEDDIVRFDDIYGRTKELK